VGIELEESSRPRLLTWSTAGEVQDVRIAGPGVDWISQADDFADHLVLPQGFAGTVRASVPAGSDGVGLAVYEVDLDRAPAGVGDPAGIFFRESSQSARQVGAGVGDAGETEILVDWSGAAGSLSMETACQDVPKGMSVNVSLTNAEIPEGESAATAGVIDSFGSCEDAGFDPGASPTSSFDVADVDPDGAATARMWVSRSSDDLRVVDPGEAPGVRLGLGLYTPDGQTEGVLGFDFAPAVEAWGHRWEYAGSLPAGLGRTVDVRDLTADGPALVSMVQRIRRGAGVSFRLATSGAPEIARTSLGTHVAGASVMGRELLLPGTTSVTVELDSGDPDAILEQRLVVHRLAD
jgi:hypothetical protein